MEVTYTVLLGGRKRVWRWSGRGTGRGAQQGGCAGLSGLARPILVRRQGQRGHILKEEGTRPLSLETIRGIFLPQELTWKPKASEISEGIQDQESSPGYLSRDGHLGPGT